MTAAETILDALAQVQRERQRRLADPALSTRVAAVKHFQQQRLRETYADLRATERYRRATTFFLEELYGPEDFTQRDAQFARVVPALVRLFPAEVVKTVVALAQLHALSERLDSEMAAAAGTAADTALAAADYALAWRMTGQPAERERQIELLMQVGLALDRHTRSRLLRTSLHMMRAPARAAGLEALQGFLEAGFDSFGTMGGAQEFMRLIGERERKLAAALFASAAGQAS